MRKDRGRHPKKARKVTQKLGAKPKTYLCDPDRYIIALAWAMELVWGCSQNDAFWLAVTWFYAGEVEHEKGRRRQPSGTVAIGLYNRPGAGASSFKSKARGLIEKATEWCGGGRRGKYRRLSMEDGRHLKTITEACYIALAPPNGHAIHHILGIMDSIGEREFAEKRLVPLVLQKTSPQQLFSQV